MIRFGENAAKIDDHSPETADFAAAYARLIENFGREVRFEKTIMKALIKRSPKTKRLDFKEPFNISTGQILTCVDTDRLYTVKRAPEFRASPKHANAITRPRFGNTKEPMQEPAAASVGRMT